MRKGAITILLLLLSTTLMFGQKLSKGIYAKIKTEKGDILLELEYEKTPLTVANFVALAEGDFEYDTLEIDEPYYDSITFHRVIKDFMIQTGDPTGSGNGNPGYAFYDEFDESLRHDTAGILSMANAGPGTNGSQFFITHKETPWLDGKHSVFGHVIEGQDVVDNIQQGDMLYSIEIIRKGWKPRFFNASKGFNKIMEAKKEELEKEEKEKKEKFKKMMSEKYPDAKETESGLMYIIKEEGDGKQAMSGRNVKVHYKGILTDGTKFDSSYDRNQPISFPLGSGRVIKGWDEGIALLKEGGKATLIIPPHLGYGSVEKGPIPANSTLIFDVELIEVN